MIHYLPLLSGTLLGFSGDGQCTRTVLLASLPSSSTGATPQWLTTAPVVISLIRPRHASAAAAPVVPNGSTLSEADGDLSEAILVAITYGLCSNLEEASSHRLATAALLLSSLRRLGQKKI